MTERYRSDADRSPAESEPLTGAPLPASEPPPPLAPPTAASRAPGPGGSPVPWGPGRTIGALGVLILLLIAEVSVIAIFDRELETLAARLGLQAALAATLVAVAFAAAKPGFGLSAPAALGLRRPTASWLGPSAVAYFGYIGCALVIAVLLAPEQEDVTRELGVDEGTLGAVAAGLLVIVVAPLTEEIFFRGFFFAGLRPVMPWLVAAAISAGIWGLFHYTGPGSWGVVLQLAIFGLWLSWLYERTGSIWPPIGIHALNNGLAFAILTSG